LADTRKQIIARIAWSLAAVAVVVLTGVALARYLDPFDDRSFDRREWVAASPRDRAPMARDAIRRIGLGMPQAEVRDLLGDPQPVSSFTGNVDAYGNRLAFPETWSYHIGNWSANPWGFDDTFLYVHFDSDAKVAAVEITGG